MKLSYLFSMFLFIYSSDLISQTDYSFGVSFGSGVNIYINENFTNDNHFRFKNPISAYMGIKVLKNLDENNNLFLDLMYARKKIEFEYDLNEPEIPFEDKEIVGQKYSAISVYFGYRRKIDFNNFSTYIEASVGSDFNSNTVLSTNGNGESKDITEPIYFDFFSNTNLGEKTITLSSNFGFGFNFGQRNQFDIGFIINIPFQEIQSKPSISNFKWEYKGKEYNHKIEYFGKVYYPSLKNYVLCILKKTMILL